MKSNPRRRCESCGQLKLDCRKYRLPKEEKRHWTCAACIEGHEDK